MTMVVLCLACIGTYLVISQLRGSMDRMQTQRVRAKKNTVQRRSRNK